MKRNLEIEEKIKEYWIDKRKASKLKSFFRKNEDCKIYCEKILKEEPNWEDISSITFHKISKDESLPKCLNCGRQMKFSKRCFKFCCHKCANNSIHRDHNSYMNSIFVTKNPMKNVYCKEKENPLVY